jgi:hypothetical protein
MSSDPSPVDRTFKLPALSYSKPVNKQSYVRISMFFNKKPGISYSFFKNHWHHVHADLVTSSDAYRKFGILRYTQFFQGDDGRE